MLRCLLSTSLQEVDVFCVVPHPLSVEVIELHHTHNGYCEACPEVARLRLEEERRKAEAATVVDPYADMHVGDWIPAWHKPLEDASGLKFLQ